MRSMFSAGGVSLAALCVAACAGVTVVQSDMAPASHRPLKRLGVASFENLSAAQGAGDTVSGAVRNALRRFPRFEVVESDQLASSDRWLAAREAQTAGVDAVIVGIITEYAYGPGAKGRSAGVTPSLAVEVRLVAAGSGQVIWAATLEVTRSQVLSFDGIPADALAQQLAEQVAEAVAALGGSG